MFYYISYFLLFDQFHTIIQPWVLFDLFKSRTLASVLTENLLKEVFELYGEMGGLESLPVGSVDAIFVALTRCQKVIELVLLVSRAEWEVSDHDGEQNDSHRKDVRLSSVINLSLTDLWSHVALGPPEGTELVDIIVGSETKVG